MGLKQIIYRIVESTRNYLQGEPEPTPEKYARRIVDATDAAISGAQVRLAQIRMELSPEERERRRYLIEKMFEGIDGAEREPPHLRYHPPEQND